MNPTDTNNAAPDPTRNGYSRNQKMARVAELITNNVIEFSGCFNELGDELIVWECRSDSGAAGWMLGEFCYYELGPWRPSLSTKVFFWNKEDAMKAMEESKAGGEYSPRR